MRRSANFSILLLVALCNVLRLDLAQGMRSNDRLSRQGIVKGRQDGPSTMEDVYSQPEANDHLTRGLNSISKKSKRSKSSSDKESSSKLSKKSKSSKGKGGGKGKGKGKGSSSSSASSRADDASYAPTMTPSPSDSQAPTMAPSVSFSPTDAPTCLECDDGPFLVPRSNALKFQQERDQREMNVLFLGGLLACCISVWLVLMVHKIKTWREQKGDALHSTLTFGSEEDGTDQVPNDVDDWPAEKAIL